MKKWIVSLGLIFFGFNMVLAQAAPKKKAATKNTRAKAPAKPKQATSAAFTLSNTSSNEALGTARRTELYIADPTIRLFNTRSITGMKQDDERAIIGIPKLRTGVAHSHIIFYPTVSSTAGTSTGSGVVGTGTSLGNMGINGASMGVNGKNPYAGPGIYGSRVISPLPPQSIPPVTATKKD